ncbi:MAG: hypothetical protein R2867_00840 [Caldilineaceae bacterium]
MCKNDEGLACHFCVDRYLPGEEPADYRSAGSADRRAAMARIKMWQPTGRTLRVCFLDGETAVQQQVARFAQEWSRYANLHFSFGTDPTSEIRISFAQPGSWSFIGTDALAVPAAEPTMNFGWLTRATPIDEVMRVVLHEFGHAIGLIHEHQNPVAAIPWNRAAVYDYYGGPPNYWCREEVNRNLFALYAKASTQFSTFDRHSIMLYPVPCELTDGDFAIGWNQTLSTLDKAFVAAWYPYPQSA